MRILGDWHDGRVLVWTWGSAPRLGGGAAGGGFVMTSSSFNC